MKLRTVQASVIALVALLPLAAPAEDPAPAAATISEAATSAAPQPAAEATDCPLACLRWGRFCNIDPRGIYKCQRTCESFGPDCD